MTKSVVLKRLSFIALAIIFGIFSAYSMAPAYIWLGMFIGLSGFYALVTKSEMPRESALYAFFWGIGYHVTGLYWIGNALLVEGNEFAWVWPISVIGLPTLLSLFIALSMYIAKRFTDFSKIEGFLAFAVMLSIGEWLRGHVFSGFPWNLYGHMWLNNLPILQSVSLFGMFSLTMLTALWCSIPAYLILSKLPVLKRAILPIILGAVFISLFAWGTARLNANPTHYNTDVTIRIVQPNIKQDEKWDSKLMLGHFKNLLSLSQPPSTSFTNDDHRTYILWPESALSPTYLDNAEIRQAIAETLSSYPDEAFLVTGALRSEQDAKVERLNYYNSMVVFDNQGEIVATYDKSHLVPLGEYIPFQDYIPIGPVVSFSGFKPGKGTQTISLPAGDNMTPLICYEVIFAFMAKGGDQRADFILNSTNDGWYGDSAGPHQHFAQSRIRAIEHGIPMMRSANTGISGVFDAYGRTINRMEIGVRGAISTPTPHTTNTRSFYNRFGDLAFLLILILTIVFICIFKRK